LKKAPCHPLTPLLAAEHFLRIVSADQVSTSTGAPAASQSRQASRPGAGDRGSAARTSAASCPCHREDGATHLCRPERRPHLQTAAAPLCCLVERAESNRPGVHHHTGLAARAPRQPPEVVVKSGGAPSGRPRRSRLSVRLDGLHRHVLLAQSGKFQSTP
jgi:hypothetical protein